MLLTGKTTVFLDFVWNEKSVNSKTFGSLKRESKDRNHNDLKEIENIKNAKIEWIAWCHMF